ncbi:hypothetical protein Hanom_Chr14g01282471 [Helianthus anomalus]
MISRITTAIELTAIFVPVVWSLWPFQSIFQKCAIFLPDVLERCHFSPKIITQLSQFVNKD